MESAVKKEVRLNMTIKEIDRVGIIKRVINKEITQKDVAPLLRVSLR